jgi:ornithine carbamoyltransferase
MGILDAASAMKREPAAWDGRLARRTLVGLFALPSTRTRLAFASAAHELGMLPFMIEVETLQLGRGEGKQDTARSISAFARVIVARLRRHADLTELAALVSVPIINALSDRHHPCEAIASLFTVREHFGRLEGLKFAYVGDGDNNFAHSLIEAAALAGVPITLAAPDGYKPDKTIMEEAQAQARGEADVVVVDDPREAVAGSHVVFTDTWVSMGDEADAVWREKAFAAYQVDDKVMSEAAAAGVFIHCLPARRGKEVTAEVLDGARSLVWKQVANHRHVIKAIICGLLGVDGTAPKQA